MSTFLVTIEVRGAASADAARFFFEAAGHKVTRVTTPRGGTATVTPVTAGMRPDATTDRPAGLDYLEKYAYGRGYAKARMAHVRKHGIPRATDTLSLREATIAQQWESHAAAHKAGMKELATEQAHPWRHRSTRQESVA